MLLAIDVGNTNIVFGLFDGEKLVHQFRAESSRGRTSDEYAVVVRQLLAMQGVKAEDVKAAIVASVVPSLTEPMLALVRRAFGKEALVVGPGIKTGMAILYENPREVGADRIVNAVAAHERWPGGAIVVDFGTATTFDVVNGKGQYVGGAISPGIEISLEALGRRGAQLRKVELARPRSVIAKNTVEALQSGMVFGVAAQVEGLVARIIAQLGVPAGDVTVISTGHLAALVVDDCACFTEHSPWLTLQGLRLVFERNS